MMFTEIVKALFDYSLWATYFNMKLYRRFKTWNDANRDSHSESESD